MWIHSGSRTRVVMLHCQHIYYQQLNKTEHWRKLNRGKCIFFVIKIKIDNVQLYINSVLWKWDHEFWTRILFVNRSREFFKMKSQNYRRRGSVRFIINHGKVLLDLAFTRPSLLTFVACVEMKRLTHEKMKEMDELTSKAGHPDTEKYKAVLERGQANLEKYKKMTVMTQNVLRVNISDRNCV